MWRTSLIVMLAAVLGAMAGTAADSRNRITDDLFQAVQNNKLDAAQKLLERGANVNARDEKGATPLMHAAVYATPQLMKLLLDKGADVKAVDPTGASALMWGIGDLKKVRLLVESGADVNARSSRTGTTPLLLAARKAESLPVVSLLVAKGADVNAIETSGVNAVILAAAAGNVDVLKLLLAKGAGTENRQTGPGFEAPNLGSEILEAVQKGANQRLGGTTALMAAVAGESAEAVRLLLAKEVEIDATTGTGITALFLASPKGNPAIVKLLLEAGANPNLKDERGFTPLILAAGSDTRNVEVVRLLLAKGAGINARDGNGETPLTWARKLGETAVVQVLRQAGATGPDPQAASATLATTGKPNVRRAAEKSLALLQSNGPQFFKKSGCISCHNVSIPLMAMSRARERGFTVNREITSRLMMAHLATLGPHRENLMQTNCTIPGIATTATYGLISMHDEGYPRDGLTDAIVHCLAGEQRPDGHWRAGDTRPPLGTGEFAATALSLHTLQLYMPDGRRVELEGRIERARRWLIETAAEKTDDRAFKVMGLAWSKAPRTDIQKSARLLLEAQRADGGWAQLPEMASDAFATSEVLVALHRGAGMPVSNAAWQRGLDFLLRTQFEDGSWHVKSRAFGFQPYFESGFPHGHDQWISAAATSWATMAVVDAAEPTEMAAR